jgi:tyrosyl-tRNA synthetase
MTSPYQFYQFWLNTDDRDVERLLRLFTFLPPDVIAAAMQEQAADPGKRAAQRALAVEVTATVHGAETTRRVAAASAILFGGADLRTAEPGTLAVVAGEVLVHPVQAADLAAGVPVVDALIGTGLAASKADARRGLQQSGYAVNGDKIPAERVLGPGDVLAGGYIVLQKGRKNYAMLEVRGE